MDQFSRGIFHIPHPQYHPNVSPSSSEQQSALKMESSVSIGQRGRTCMCGGDLSPKLGADGWLIIESARAKVIAANLEAGDMQVLRSEVAQDQRSEFLLPIDLPCWMCTILSSSSRVSLPCVFHFVTFSTDTLWHQLPPQHRHTHHRLPALHSSRPVVVR